MGTSWANWAGEQRCAPARIAAARSAEQVSALVSAARADGLVVKAPGSGHSFSDAALTDGVMIDTSGLRGVLDADRESGLVKVGAGITIHDLNIALADLGLALENLGDIDLQTIAGATATATHGTGATLGNISSRVEAIELVDGNGDLVELGAADGDALRAARVSVGALGVITALTLRCVPAYVLRMIDRPIALDAVLADLDSHVDGHRHFEFFVFPHADRALTRTTDIVEAEPRPRSPAGRWVTQRLLGIHTFHAICAAGKALPGQIPRLNRLITSLAGSDDRTDDSYRLFASPREVRFTEMEYAVPRAAVPAMLAEIREVIDREGFAVNFPIEVRFVAPDDALLSPAHGRETGYLAVHMYAGMEWEPYLRAVEAIAEGHEGRPHWGKRHFQTAATLAGRYPAWDRFQEVRRRLDPAGVFANAYTDRVLGPAGG